MLSRTALMSKCMIRPLTNVAVRCVHNPWHQFTEEHDKLRESVRKVVDTHVNPHVEEWEEKGQFDAHYLFKKMGDAGLLGITRPTEYGGLGLDYSFTVAFIEEMSETCNCAGVPAGILVHTDMCTPALTRFGSDELKRNFLAPSIAGDLVGCVGVSEPDQGSDVANIKTSAKFQVRSCF